MFKQSPAFLQRISSLALLLMLSLATIATCPVKSLIFDLDTARIDTKSQPKLLDRASPAISCTIDYAVAEASLLDIHKSGIQKVAVFLLFAILLFRSVGIANALKPPFHRDKYRKPLSIPLFLKNSSFLL